MANICRNEVRFRYETSMTSMFDIAEVRDETLETRGHNKGWGYGREINEQFLGCRQAPKKQFNKEYNYKISIICI